MMQQGRRRSSGDDELSQYEIDNDILEGGVVMLEHEEEEEEEGESVASTTGDGHNMSPYSFSPSNVTSASNKSAQGSELQSTDADLYEGNSKEEKLRLTDTSPPGPELFTAWTADDFDHELTNAHTVEAVIKNFMGPADTSVVSQMRRRRREKIKGGSVTYDSVSYKMLDTAVWHNYTKSMHGKRMQRPITPIREVTSFRSCRKKVEDDSITKFLLDTRFVVRLVIIAIGIAVSIGGFIVEVCSDQLLTMKINYTTGIGTGAYAFVLFLVLSLASGLVAFIPITYRPVSAGSGIAEAKAVLNGVILPTCTDLITTLCKGISVIFASVASLPVGLEGPMIFMGLSLGENAQRFLPKKYVTLHTERYRRDLAALGTASGVTSAFLSPVGGVLFAMEEGSSFWSVMLAWRSFGAACVTAIFSYTWYLLLDNNGLTFSVPMLEKFHGFPGQSVPSVTFRLYDYFIFAAMGVVGGLIGGVWCELNRGIAIRRNMYITGPVGRFAVVQVLVASMASLVWWLPTILKVCGSLDDTSGAEGVFRQFGCPDGEYNHLATLLLNPPGSVGINLLFWEPIVAFRADCCLIAGTVYLVVLLLCFGSSISMGIFIPLLYVGAAYGRALGLVTAAGNHTYAYAIVGSVVMLAGVIRVLISITVIMMTCTGLPYLVTPFMVGTLCARVSGKWLFGRAGIYDIILNLKQIPFLEEQPTSSIDFHGLRARHIMSTPLVSVEPEMQVGALLTLLKENSFLDFPVTDPTRNSCLVGLITRGDILRVLSNRILFYTKDMKKRPRALRQLELMSCYFDLPKLAQVEAYLEEMDMVKYVDLTPYLEIAHYTFNQNGCAPRAYELFRLLGLRNLIITGASGIPVGVITRYDLKLLDDVTVNADHDQRARKADLFASYQTIS